MASASRPPSWSLSSSAGTGGFTARAGVSWRTKLLSTPPQPACPSMRRATWSAASGSHASTQAVGSSIERVSADCSR
jgi:hypothetical protein